jgi:hypothetical protein
MRESPVDPDVGVEGKEGRRIVEGNGTLLGCRWLMSSLDDCGKLGAVRAGMAVETLPQRSPSPLTDGRAAGERRG